MNKSRTLHDAAGGGAVATSVSRDIEDIRDARGLLVVMTGASGTGKSTLLRRLFERDDRLALSVSHTTRQPRPREADGSDYYFVDEERFEEMVAQEAFAEWAHVHAHRYGTSRAEVERLRSQGRDIIFDIDVQGAENLIRAYPEAITIFVLPPSMACLEERLRGRRTEDDGQLAIRLGNARREIERAREFQYVVINDAIESAVNAFHGVIRAERQRTTRHLGRIERLLTEAPAGARQGND